MGKFFLRQTIALIFALSIFTSSVRANHILGMDMKYTHISGSTYQIICAVYGDCSSTTFGNLFGSTPLVSLFDGTTNVDCITLYPIPTSDSVFNIAKIIMCPADSNNTTCTNPSSSIQGIEKFTFSATYTLPYASHTWRFVFSGDLGNSAAGRSKAITNIPNSPVTFTQIEDSLDNTMYDNSNPNLGQEPDVIFCLNNNDTYNPIAVDPDGDSLVFALIPGTAGNNNCPTTASGYPTVTYLAGYSATSPLSVNPGTFSFNSNTGQINFNPIVQQRSLVVYNISEYHHGVFVGSSQREMNFEVLPCTITPPTATISGAIDGTIGGSDSSVFTVCQNTLCSFQINPRESDPTNLIFVTAIGLPSWATVHIVGDSTNAPNVTISCNTAGVTPGSYPFYMKFVDNACPVNGQSELGFTINVSAFNASITGPDSLCEGSSVTLGSTLSGGTWSSTNTGVATINSGGTTVGVDTGSTYIFYTDPVSGCSADIVFHVVPSVRPISGPSTVCAGSSIGLTDSTTGGTWSISGTSAADINATGGLLTGLTSGVVTVTYGLSGGCIAFHTVTVNAAPGNISGAQQLCVGQSYSYSNSVSGGTWSLLGSGMTIGTSGSGVGTAEGIDTVRYALGDGCTSQLVVTVNPIPSITGTDSGCTAALTTLSVTPGGGTWVSSNPSVATVAAGGATVGNVIGVHSGLDTLTYTSPAGCVNQVPYRINLSVPNSIFIVDTPNTVQCYGTPVNFNAYTTNGGASPILTWEVNGVPVGTGSTFTYDSSHNGDIVKCILIADTVCASPSPNSSNGLVMAVIKNTPGVKINSIHGDTSCAGVPVTYVLSLVDTGVTPLIEWTYNLALVATNTTTFTCVPTYGDVITCTVTVDLPCASPNPAIFADTLRVLPFATPTLTLAGGGAICEGNTATISTTANYGGSDPTFYWTLNGSPITATGGNYTFMPHTGDSVACTMVSNYPCPVPSDTVSKYTTIVVDTVLDVTISAVPGQLVANGQNDTFTANAIRAGYDPSYQWFVNGVIVPGATARDFITNSLHNFDSVSCIVTTGSGTPCQGIQGFNWLRVTVAPLGIDAANTVLGGFTIEPNPTSGVFYVVVNAGIAGIAAQLEVVDGVGKTMLRQLVPVAGGKVAAAIRLDADVPNGLYFVKLTTDNDCRVRRVLLQR